MKCGKPTMAEEVASVTRGAARETRRIDEEGRPSREGFYRERSLKVENWYYDRGRHEFIYILTFIGGKLVNIKTGGYGRGYSPDEPARRSDPAGEKGRADSDSESAPSGALPSGDQERGEEQTKGKIDLVGTPYGAKVYLDEYYAGNIPCTLEEVAAGAHNLLVKQEGFGEWRERVDVKGGVTLWLAVHLPPDEESGKEVDLKSDLSTPPKRLYKWTDDQGRIHITETPPPDSMGKEATTGPK